MLNPRVEQIERLVGIGHRVLDIGCSIGEFAIPLSRDNLVIGWDIRPQAQRACEKVGLAVSLVDVEEDRWLPMPAADVILCLELLEHLDDPLVFLTRLRARARADHQLIVSTPNAAYLKWRWQLLIHGEHPLFGEDRQPHGRPYNLEHKTPLTIPVLTDILTQAGYRIVHLEPEAYPPSGLWRHQPWTWMRSVLQRGWPTLFAGAMVVVAEPC